MSGFKALFADSHQTIGCGDSALKVDAAYLWNTGTTGHNAEEQTKEADDGHSSGGLHGQYVPKVVTRLD